MDYSSLVFIVWEDSDGAMSLSPFNSPVLPQVGNRLCLTNIDNGQRPCCQVVAVEFNLTVSEIEEETDLENILIYVSTIDDDVK